MFFMIFIIKINMAKARKEGKSKRNRSNLKIKLDMIKKNSEIIAKYMEKL